MSSKLKIMEELVLTRIAARGINFGGHIMAFSSTRSWNQAGTRGGTYLI